MALYSNLGKLAGKMQHMSRSVYYHEKAANYIEAKDVTKFRILADCIITNNQLKQF